MAQHPGGSDDRDRGIERLIFFTDAVVAIAITLLILPLVEIVTTDADKHLPVVSFLFDNLSQLFAFALSFVIIARLWVGNHEILVNTARSTHALIWLDFAWAFTIVVQPLSTEITAVYKSSILTVSIYIGTSFVSMAILAWMSGYLHRHPELQKSGHPVSAVQVWGVTSTAVGFIIAFALSLIFPVLTYYSLLVLLLTGPLDAIVKPRIRRREAARNESK